MNGGLRELWGLAEARARGANGQGAEFGDAFREAMSRVNKNLQVAAATASRTQFLQVDSQRTRLYEAFQKASAPNGDPATATQSMQRVLTVVKLVEEKSAGLAAGASAGREEWLKREADFDAAKDRIGELEDARHPKVATLRKLGDVVEARVNTHEYKAAVSAFDQLRPKLDSLYAQHQAGAGAADRRAGGFIGASVGKGGKNSPEDVKAVQEALNTYGDVKVPTDGQYSRQVQQAIEGFQRKLGQFKPDGLIQPGRGPARVLSGQAKMPPPAPEPRPIEPPVLGKASLDKGAFVWHSTRGILNTNIEELKKGVRGAYGAEHPDLMQVIDKCLGSLGKVVDTLDTRLADSLDAAYQAPNDKARFAELKKAQGIMREYLVYVKSEPLIDNMDDNPFGVKTSLKKVITDALKHLSELLPKTSAANT